MLVVVPLSDIALQDPESYETYVQYVQISDIGFRWVFYFTGLEMMAAMYILHALTLCGKEFAARTLEGRRILGFLPAWFSR